MDPMTIYAIGQGARTLGDIVDISGQRRRKKKEIEKIKRDVLGPIQARQRQAGIGPTEAEGAGIRGSVDRTLRSLGSRGVLDSSMAAGEVAGAVAPFEVQRQGQLDDLAKTEAAAQAQIAGLEGEVPGFGDAFAGGLGATGQFLALRAGQKQARQDRREESEEFLRNMVEMGLFPNVSPTAFRTLSSESFGSLDPEDMNQFAQFGPLAGMPQSLLVGD